MAFGSLATRWTGRSGAASNERSKEPLATSMPRNDDDDDDDDEEEEEEEEEEEQNMAKHPSLQMRARGLGRLFGVRRHVLTRGTSSPRDADHRGLGRARRQPRRPAAQRSDA